MEQFEILLTSASLMSRIGPQSQAIAIIEGPNDGEVYDFFTYALLMLFPSSLEKFYISIFHCVLSIRSSTVNPTRFVLLIPNKSLHQTLDLYTY